MSTYCPRGQKTGSNEFLLFALREVPVNRAEKGGRPARTTRCVVSVLEHGSTSSSRTVKRINRREPIREGLICGARTTHDHHPRPTQPTSDTSPRSPSPQHRPLHPPPQAPLGRDLALTTGERPARPRCELIEFERPPNPNSEPPNPPPHPSPPPLPHPPLSKIKCFTNIIQT